MKPLSPAILGILVSAPIALNASTTVATSLLSSYNAVVFDDYNPQGADTEGGVIVGGSMNITSNLPFNSNQSGLAVSAYANSFTFTGAGAALQVQNGDIVTPSSPTAGNFSFNGGGSLISGAAGQSAYESFFTGLGITSATLESTIVSASATWSALPATAAIQNPGQNLRFAAGSGNAVFNISANDVFQQNYNPQWEKQADTTSILINVSGTAIDNTSFGQNIVNMPEDFRSLVIWNFYEATTLDLSKFAGAVVAPNAVTSIAEPNGSVITKELTHADELHLDLFVGSDPNELTGVPEPSTSLLALVAAAGIIRRRR